MADTFSKLARRAAQPALEFGASACTAQEQREDEERNTEPPSALGKLGRLPKELISRISFYLPPDAMFKFIRASKSIHSTMASSGALNSIRFDKFKTIHATNNGSTYDSMIRSGAVPLLLEWLESTHTHSEGINVIAEFAASLPNHINNVCGCLNGQGNFILLQLIDLSRRLKPDARDRVLLQLHQSIARLGCEDYSKESLAAEKLKLEWKRNVAATFGDTVSLSDTPVSELESSTTAALSLNPRGTIDIRLPDGTIMTCAANLSEVKRKLAAAMG